MGEYYLEQVTNFVNEFTKMYKADFYVSKKVLDHLFDKYKDIIELKNDYRDKQNEIYIKFIKIVENGYEFIDERNKKYIDIKLKEEKEYFDNMFINIDKNIKLDQEQRKAIIIDEDYSLIVAGAGAGKTTTMAAKVKYLVEKRGVNPEEIILLSFTNASVKDLDDLINEKFKLGVEVLTFHKLGMKFLRGTSESRLEIVADAGMYKILEEYFLNVVFKNKEMLKEYMELYNKFLHLEEEAYNFDDFNEYYKTYIKKKLIEIKDYKKEIRERIKQRAIYFKTINGEYVKSKGEFEIANYLYKNSIEYEYEGLYPNYITDNRTYKPDFTIYDFDKPIYIEYYGLAQLMKNNTIYCEKEHYKEIIKKKRNVHRNYKTDCIELFGRYEDKKIYHLPKLSIELSYRRIPKEKKTDQEILTRLLETSKQQKYAKLIRLFMVHLSIFKERAYDLEELDQLISKCESNILKRKLICFREVYIYYENFLRHFNKIDFEDMINIAYKNIEKIKMKMKNLNFKYVIIDEYQDVSFSRHNLTKKISDIFNAKMVAVGDDWQTIFSFSGSDINLFVKFEENMGYCATTKILNTYRNSQELIDIAGEFVTKNKEQIPKRLLSEKRRIKPVRIVKYKYLKKGKEINNKYQKLVSLIKKIYKAHPDDNILLLTRFNMEIDELLMNKHFYMPNRREKEIICDEVPNAKIDILTVHKSKGLGYDRVILLNGINDIHGFPSQVADEEIVSYIKCRGESKIQKDNIFDEIVDIVMYPEERRLFYVAMTRTKNEFYIMSPSNRTEVSEFVLELSNYKDVAILDKEIE